MDETKRAGEEAVDTNGSCKCEDLPVPNLPDGTKPFRRLLNFLEESLEEISEPTEATKKFADDLKDADKEYQGIGAIVDKYKQFYEKVDCKLAEANSQKEEITSWLVGKLEDEDKCGIQHAYTRDYETSEHDRCCDWINARKVVNGMLDCLEQSKRIESDRKDDYDGIKAFEKTLGDRFGDLKSLYDKGKALRDAESYKAVFALSLEYSDVYDNLALLRDWAYAQSECPGPPQAPGDLKTEWTPEEFKRKLILSLRNLILAKHQRFLRQQDSLTKTSESAKYKEACEKFRKERRDKFIQEADDIPPEKCPDAGKPAGGGSDQAPAPKSETSENRPKTSAV